MKIANILSEERTSCSLEASSKKKALEEVAIKLAEAIPDLTADDLFAKLINREKMGSTAIGNGIAIPHCRLDSCQEILGGLFSLKQPVDFEAFDDQPVQLLFVLLVPTEEVDEHLQVLAMLARRFESDTYRKSLLSADSDAALFEVAASEAETPVTQAHH